MRQHTLTQAARLADALQSAGLATSRIRPFDWLLAERDACVPVRSAHLRLLALGELAHRRAVTA